MDRRSLSPEGEQLLGDFEHYLQPWSYSSIPYRVALARTFLHWWARPLGELSLPDRQAFVQHRQNPRDHAIATFRKFLRETGRWVPPRPAPPEQRPLDAWPEATAHGVLGFLAFRKRRGQVLASREGDRQRLVEFLETLPPEGAADLTQVTHRHVAAYIETLQDRGLAPGTINRRLATLRMFFRWLSREGGYPRDNPVREDHTLTLPPPLPRALPPEDVRALLAVVDDVCLRALFLVLLRSGLRIGEALALTVDDVDLEQATLTLYQGAKNGRGRVVYLAADARQALADWVQERQGYPVRQLFFRFLSHGLSKGWVQMCFQRYVAEAGLTRHYRLHDLRHTFATDLLNAGVPLTTLQELMGHISLPITQRYARVADPVKRGQYFAAMGQRAQQGQLGWPSSQEEAR